jgi:hypothetical protein
MKINLFCPHSFDALLDNRLFYIENGDLYIINSKCEMLELVNYNCYTLKILHEDENGFFISGGTPMKLKKEHIEFLNETARIDFDSALQMVDGVNMLSEVEYGFVNMNDGEHRLVYWEDGILKDAYRNCED